jgi:hypothetical protein
VVRGEVLVELEEVVEREDRGDGGGPREERDRGMVPPHSTDDGGGEERDARASPPDEDPEIRLDPGERVAVQRSGRITREHPERDVRGATRDDRECQQRRRPK